MTEPVIQVRALRKVYAGGVEAVRGIDFDVGAGEVFGLLGPNGAGKSTTIGMLTTTIAPTSGSARLAGFDVARAPRAARGVASVVFQEPVVDRALSGRANLELHARLWGVAPAEAAKRIAALSDALGVARLLDRGVGGIAAGSAGGWRSPARWSRGRACCSSTSRPSASIRASAMSGST